MYIYKSDHHLIYLIEYDYLENYVSKQYGIQNVLDLELGIEYLKDFNQSNARLEISVGWEQQVWINQTFYLPKSGNLTLQGLNTKLGLSF